MSALKPQACWIVGYGNRQRRDDGIGPYVVERLQGGLQQRKDVHLLAPPQLSADLVGELRDADLLLFIDASIEKPRNGRKWCKLHPEMRLWPYLTHHIGPGFLLALMESLYGRTASAWLISVWGTDFGFGEGLSPEAGRIAERVIREILGFIGKKNWVEGFKVHSSRLRNLPENRLQL